jgi:Fe-S oxidoreductase
MAESEKYQSVTLEEHERQIWTCMQCYCGLCIEGCPAYRVLLNEALATRGLSQIAIAILQGEIDLAGIPDVNIYSCTGCRWCEWNCAMNTPLYIMRHGTRKNKVSGATIGEILRAMKVERGEIPPEVRDTLSNIVRHGNPYGIPKARKDKWVDDLGLRLDEQDTVLYVGATVPFEDRATAMAEATIDLLRSAGVEFGIIGGDEMDSGAFARPMGEEGLFEEMVEHNLRTFKEHKIKRIICLSPHDHDAFLSYYENMDGIEIKHYTQVLWEMIEAGKIKPTKETKRKVTYHDPCYLGRRLDIYEEPRKILQSIPGLELVETHGWTRERSFCCGGGGIGLFYDIPGVDIDLTRADQIKEGGAECVAVACPICLQMLDDAMKSRDYEIEVKDVARLVKEAT